MKLKGGPVPPIVVLALTVAIGAGCSRSPFQTIPPDQVDQSRKEAAERIARRLFSSWKMGIFNALGDEFSPEMQRAFTPRAQRQAYQSLKMLYGDLENLRFVEAVHSRNLPDVVIYRFRGKFTGTRQEPEVRVVMDGEGKVSGFWCKPWRRRIM